MTALAERPTTDDRIRAALWFAERGFGVFSVWSTTADGTCRCPKGATCDNAGKHPITPHGFQDATTDPDRIRTLLSAGSEPNYGLVCPEGVFALDVDGELVERLAELELELGPLPPSLRTMTANGFHAFFRWPAELPRPIGQMFGMVTRWGSGANAGYVIGPRSVHASGKAYAPAGVADIATLPDAWAQRAVGPAPVPTDRTVTIAAGGYELPERVGAGESRYEAIRDYVAHLYNRGFETDEMWLLVRDRLAPRFAESLSEPEVRSRFDRTVAGLEARLGERRAVRGPVVPAPLTPEQLAATSIDAADLLELELPPLQWIVPRFIPEGTTILAGPPKLGKSCLVYQITAEVALGGELLGEDIEQGEVLYLALEDGKRRGQTRLRAALGGRQMPRHRLEVRWSSSKLGADLEEELVAWLDAHPKARLVAIDTLQKTRGMGDSRRNAYAVDVEDLGRLQDLFRDRTTGLLVVHHTKKDNGDDFLASVSGTYGITGSADTTLVLQRKRLEQIGKLVVTGRDVEEVEQAVRFDGLTWTLAPESLAAASFEQGEVYKVIEARGPVFAKAIAEEIGSTREAVQRLIEKLVTNGAVTRTSGGYVVAALRVVIGGRGSEEAQEAENGHIASSASSSPRAYAPAGVPTSSASSTTSGPTREEEEEAGTRDTRAGGRPRARGRCPECGRDVDLTASGNIRSHRHAARLDDAAWGDEPCPGSGMSPEPTGPAPEPVVEPAGTEHVTCYFYAEHQSAHRRDGDRWVCDICAPEVAS